MKWDGILKAFHMGLPSRLSWSLSLCLQILKTPICKVTPWCSSETVTKYFAGKKLQYKFALHAINASYKGVNDQMSNIIMEWLFQLCISCPSFSFCFWSLPVIDTLLPKHPICIETGKSSKEHLSKFHKITNHLCVQGTVSIFLNDRNSWSHTLTAPSDLFWRFLPTVALCW